MDLLPNELGNIVKDYAIFKPNNYDELKEAVDLWCIDREKALPIYGHISVWDTSLITDMSNLFENKTDFNDNINNWNVSSVTDMCFMFANASLFNQPLNSWDVSSVTDMSDMFHEALSFNQDIGLWIIKQDTDIEHIFENSGVTRETFLSNEEGGTGRGIYGTRIARYFNPSLPNPKTYDELKKERNWQRRKNFATVISGLQKSTNLSTPEELRATVLDPLSTGRVVGKFIGGQIN